MFLRKLNQCAISNQEINGDWRTILVDKDGHLRKSVKSQLEAELLKLFH